MLKTNQYLLFLDGHQRLQRDTWNAISTTQYWCRYKETHTLIFIFVFGKSKLAVLSKQKMYLSFDLVIPLLAMEIILRNTQHAHTGHSVCCLRSYKSKCWKQHCLYYWFSVCLQHFTQTLSPMAALEVNTFIVVCPQRTHLSTGRCRLFKVTHQWEVEVSHGPSSLA